MLEIIAIFVIIILLFIFFCGYSDNILRLFFHKMGDHSLKIKISDTLNQEFYHHPRSSVLWVRLPSWGETISTTNPLKNKMVMNKYSFLDYQFSTKILSSNQNLTKKYFEEINGLVISDIKRLKKQYNFSRVNILGASIGTSNTFTIVNNSPKLFDKIVVICPGNSLADGMWEGINTQFIRRAYERKGISLEKLKKSWKNLAPESNLKNLKDKEIVIYLSKSDKLVPYECGVTLLASMNKNGIKPLVRENKYLGHYLTIIKAYFFPDYL